LALAALALVVFGAYDSYPMYLESFLTEAMNQLTAKLVYNNEKAPNTDSKFFINSSKLTRK